MNQWYQMDENGVITPKDYTEAAAAAPRWSIKDYVKPKRSHKKYLVSTVFLGLDHSFGAPGPPVLFETMVFDRTEDHSKSKNSEPSFLDLYCRRYTSKAAAEAGHAEVVATIKQGNKAAKALLRRED